MKTRVISGLIGIAVALLALSMFNSIAFNLIAVILYAIAVYEIYHTFQEGNSILIPILLGVLGAGVLLFPYINILSNLTLTAAVFMLVFACIVVFQFDHIRFSTVASTVFFGIFVLVGFFSICRLKVAVPFSQYGWDGAFLFVFAAVIAWGGDIMAYFTGYFFGKHKLAPTLSPKKTIEGAIGGVVGSVVFTWLFMWLYCLIKPIIEGTAISYSMDTGHFITIGAIAAVGSLVGMVGDLFASAIKRQAGIKDYGNIMPGHGGVLDRFDSVLLVAPLVSSMAGIIVRSGGIFNV